MVILVWYLWHIVVDIVDIYKVIKSENEPFVEKVCTRVYGVFEH